MTKLISMVDYIIQAHEACVSSTANNYNYAKFLKTPLSIEQFVPCKLVDGVWKPIKDPKEYKNWLEIQKHGGYYLCHNSNEYQKALDKILFEGIQFADIQPSTEYNYYHFNGNKVFQANNQYNFFPVYRMKTIEDLVFLKPTLTPNTIKNLGL